ncbi:MAG: DUF3782 domain-containing protein [Planctomycetaceae bacterium]|nr:DUF3782 domain-containing protein [Planctomycetaceae bacterium]
MSEQHKVTEKSIAELSEQHKVTEKSIAELSEQHKVTEKNIAEMSEQRKAIERATEKAIAEISEQHKITEKSLQELSKQHEEAVKERKETEKVIKKLSKQMGSLGNRFGELAEHLVFPAVVRRFNEIGYNFSFEFAGNCKVRDKNNRIIAEIDAYLENGTTIAVVEVKTKPDVQDIEKHIQRIEKLKQNRREKNEPPKILLGAIAGAIFPKEVKEAAQQAGFYVLVQSGDTMRLEIPAQFEPRKF